MLKFDKLITHIFFSNRSSTQFPRLFFGGFRSIENLLLYSSLHQNVLGVAPEFIGCIGNVTINNIAINAAEILQLQNSEGVTVGCKRENVCLDNPCGYGNDCIDRWSGYECRCHRNYIASGCMRGTVLRGMRGTVLRE